MNLVEFKNVVSQYKGGFFGVRNYANKYGEISNYVINVKANYANLKEKDIDICCKIKTKTELEINAKSELLNAFLNPSKSTKNRIKGQNDAYTYIADGIKMHKETMDLFFVGQKINKKIIKKGSYPIVKSKPLTIEKNKMRKLFSSSNYRTFKIGNIGDIKDFKLSGKTIEFIL